VAGLVLGVEVVVLAAQLQAEQVTVPSSSSGGGTVLAAPVALVVGDPGPADLAGIGAVVVAGAVLDVRGTGGSRS